MIVLLVSINVLFYCVKTNLNSALTITYTVSSMIIALLAIFVYRQSSRRNRISMAKYKSNGH